MNIRGGGDVYTYNVSSYDNIQNENSKDKINISGI